MKKILYLLIFLILVGFVYGEDLYQYNFLDLNLGVKGAFKLMGEGSGAKIESVKAELSFYPKDNLRQKLSNWTSEGEIKEGKVVFEWGDQNLGEKVYGFKAEVKTENKRLEINKKALFPLSGTEGFENYLDATESIDKDNPLIIAKAAELAEGEDDLFKVVFKLARWVEKNIRYDLTTLTASTSQKASWVLEQRRGVCDEMTSLFIAMCRALGIPARFVSGVSYTTSDLFEENWLPHGWAEVYFPDYGWVSFDIAFGEYGYVDVTHIKLRDGFDPTEASTNFEWLGNKVKLETSELNFSVEVKDKGNLSEKGISLGEEILGKEVGIGSYNLIKGIVENKEDYYTAITLKLAAPEGVEITGEEKKIILLEPKERKEVFWLVKVSNELPKNYWYEFPIIIYSEENVSVKGKFKALEGRIFYSKEEAESLVSKEEEKRYLGKVDFDCDYKREIKLGEKNEISCKIKNEGNINLEGIKFCLGGVCKIIDLLINQENDSKIKIKGEEAGWQKIIVSAENEKVIRKNSLVYSVLDDPKIDLAVKKPEVVDYGKDFEISLGLTKDSFSIPKNLSIILKGTNFENKWSLEELRDEKEFVFKTKSRGLGKENEFKIIWEWEDQFGEKFKEEKIITVRVEGKTFWEKTKLFFNGIINWLS